MWGQQLQAVCISSGGLWAKSICLCSSVLYDQFNWNPTSKSLTLRSVVPWITSRIKFKMYAMPTTSQFCAKVAAFCNKCSLQLSCFVHEHLQMWPGGTSPEPGVLCHVSIEFIPAPALLPCPPSGIPHCGYQG